MSPSRQCVCMHISDPGRDGDKDKFIAHAHSCIPTNIVSYAHTEKEKKILPGSLGLSCCLILIHLQN